jgi:flagellar motor switch protein FliG
MRGRPENMRTAVDELTGRQKAAILFMTLGPEASAKLMRDLPPDELEAITVEIARLEHVPPELVQAVLEEMESTQQAAHSLASGGIGFARTLLQETLGPQKAETVLKRIETQVVDVAGFQVLRKADPRQLATLLSPEHPQTIALILASLGAEQAAPVLQELPAELAAEVLFRMARMEKVRPEVLQMVETALGSQSGVTLTRDTLSSVGGPAAVAAVLNLVAGPLESQLLGGLSVRNAELCEQIRNLMFVFEDLIRLDDASLSKVLREVDAKELALALKAASDELKQKILGTMSQRAVKALQEEMEFLGPVRMRDVEKAQAAVVKSARALEEQGEIVLGGDGDDLVQ